MRGRTEGGNKKKPVIVLLCVAAVVLVSVYLFFGSSSHAIEYGRKLGLGGDATEKEDASTSFYVDDDANGFTPRSFPVCDDRHSELIPCLDRNLIYQMRLKLDLSLMEHYERHCPPPERRFNCLIPPPPGYKVPIKWPNSRDEVWKVNIPHTHLAHEKSDQNWMVVKGDKINFPGGGTHFHYGADKYIASMANMLNFPNNILNNEGRLRTFLDVGCGVASFGGYLLASDIMTMSLAPNDVHQNQIQFALERGIPAYLGVLGTKRLPYPSRSFELAHCSRCRIDWLQRDGILLLELDRVLRPGGYFAYSSPEAYAQDEEDLRIWREMSALVERMCWTIAAKRNQTVIWQKPMTNDCYLEREPGTQPPLCNSDSDPDAVYGVNMEACITQYSDHDHKTKGSGLSPWPARLTSPPPRLADFGYSTDMFEKDTETWKQRVDAYWDLLSPAIQSDTVRNIMDMKANMGSFAAALNDKDVWVMNVVPEDGPNTLKLIYDRGLMGAVHSWCEAFSTYPRTYDLLHAWDIISDIKKRGCSAEDLLLEMDRILRPSGFILIRDTQSVVDLVKKYLKALHWEAVDTKATSDSAQHIQNTMTTLVIFLQLLFIIPLALGLNHPNCDLTNTQDQGSTLRIFHIDSPCSPFKSSSPLSWEARVLKTLAQDQARLQYLTSLVAGRSVVPVASGRQMLQSTTYIVKAKIGTPAQSLLLAMDTSSDVAWLPCSGCVGCPSTTAFSPAKSTTFKNVSCSAPQCKQVPNPTCGSRACSFNLTYGSSSIAANLSQDTIRLAADPINAFTFGCVNKVAGGGTVPPPQGLLGLGRGPLSLMSQAQSLYKSTFSYCLPSFRSLAFSGSLRLGPTAQPVRVKYTQLLRNPRRSSLYYVNLVAIRVAKKVVDIPPAAIAFNPTTGAGTIFDSGTVYTRLSKPVYEAVRNEFRKRVKPRTAVVTSLGGFDTCYSGKITVPTITFMFKGVNMTMPADNLMLHSSAGSLSCLAIASSPENVNSVVNVIASMQQQNHRVLIDVPNGRLGLARERCS